MSEGFDFLGFRIQWRRKRGMGKWYVCTFIADRPIRSLKDKIRALTNRTSQQDPGTVLIRLNQIMRGMGGLLQARCLQEHPGRPGELRVAQGDPLVDGTAPLEVERRTPAPHRPHRPVAQALGGRDRVVQHRLSSGHPVPLPRQQDPQSLDGSQPRLQRPWRARCGEICTAGSASGLEKRTGSNSGTALQADSTVRRQDRLGLSFQECLPGLPGTPGCGVDARVLQESRPAGEWHRVPIPPPLTRLPPDATRLPSPPGGT